MSSTRLYSSDFDTPHIAIVPLGSWEQHGPHLPLDTDTVIASTLCVRACGFIGDNRLLVLPSVNYTASDEHHGFAGTASIATESAERTFTLIARSLSENSPHLRGIVFVNGHGGNVSSMKASSSALVHHGVPHKFWTPTFESNGDLHAGHLETSVMMAIDSEHVRHSQIVVGAIGDTHHLISQMGDHGVHNVSPNGVIGDATLASASFGDEMLSQWTTDLVRLLHSAIKEWLNKPSDVSDMIANHL